MVSWTIVDLLYTYRPVFSQCTCSITEEEIYSKFGFSIGRIIHLSEATFIKPGVQSVHLSYLIHCNVHKFEGIKGSQGALKFEVAEPAKI